MKSFGKFLLIGLALLASVAAGAEPGSFDHNPTASRARHGERLLEERLTALHQALKLTTAQEADWNAWAAKVRETKRMKKEARPDRETLKTLPAPERLDRMLAFAKEKQAYLEEVLAATKTFYATLTPEQRKTFDDLTPFGERAPAWMRHGSPRHPSTP